MERLQSLEKTVKISIHQQLDKEAVACMQDTLGDASEGVSESFSSATADGKTKTAYQKGKGGAASASAFASDMGNAAGQQAQNLKRAAGGRQKSTWEKAKVCPLCCYQACALPSKHCWLNAANALLRMYPHAATDMQCRLHCRSAGMD